MQRQINEDELAVFYHEIGAAVWLIQYLEDVLVTFMSVKKFKRQPTTAAEALSRLEKERKGTLGSICKKAKAEGIITPSLEGRFDALLDERNWLIHNSRKESSTTLYNDELREKMFQRIRSIQEESDQLKKLLFEDYCAFLQAQGVDLCLGFKIGEENIRKLKGL